MRVPDILRFLISVLTGHAPAKPAPAAPAGPGGHHAHHAWLPEEGRPSRHCPFFVR